MKGVLDNQRQIFLILVFFDNTLPFSPLFAADSVKNLKISILLLNRISAFRYTGVGIPFFILRKGEFRMLLMFKVKNYMSFREETILDMRATSYVQHPSHVISVNERLRLLKITLLYGANASGKSNFISAMFFFERYIFSQFFQSGRMESDISEENTVSLRLPLRLQPFALADKGNDESEFEIIFLRGGKMFQYGFVCSPKKEVSPPMTSFCLPAMSFPSQSSVQEFIMSSSRWMNLTHFGKFLKFGRAV